MIKWEQDLNTSFSATQWQTAIRSTYKASRCVTHWEQSQKILTRWYLTPYRLSTFYKQSDPLCWRGCGHIGNIYHIFWSCKSLMGFWRKVFELLSTVTGVLSPTDPALALLLLGIENIPLDIRTVFVHILIAARSTIARKWKQPDPPSHLEVIRQVNTQFSMEKANATAMSQRAKFDHLWSSWTSSKYYTSVL